MSEEFDIENFNPKDFEQVKKLYSKLLELKQNMEYEEIISIALEIMARSGVVIMPEFAGLQVKEQKDTYSRYLLVEIHNEYNLKGVLRVSEAGFMATYLESNIQIYCGDD